MTCPAPRPPPALRRAVAEGRGRAADRGDLCRPASPKRPSSLREPGTRRSTCGTGTPGFASARARPPWRRARSRIPCPTAIFHRDGNLWLPLLVEGEAHGILRLDGVASGEIPPHAGLLSFVLGAVVATHRLAKAGPRGGVRAQGSPARARVPLRSRALPGRSARSREPRRRSALPFDLADRRRQRHAGPHRGLRSRAPRAKRRRRGGLGPRCRGLDAPGGRHHQQRGGRLGSHGRHADRGCEKCLAAPISVPGRRSAFSRSPTRSRATGAFSTSPRPMRGCCRSSPTRPPARSRRRASTRDAIEKERIERELELAAAIQRQILPRDLPAVPGLEIAARNRPTRQVGGDYFDFFPLSRRAARVSRRRRLRQGRAGGSARVDGARRRAPADRRGEDRRRPDRPDRPAPPEVRRDPQVPDVLLRSPRTRDRGAALRVGRTQPGAAAPCLGRRGAGQAPRACRSACFPTPTWREETLVMERGRSSLRLQRRHHRGARYGGRGVRPRAADAADVDRTGGPHLRAVFDAVSAFAGDAPQYDDQTLLLHPTPVVRAGAREGTSRWRLRDRRQRARPKITPVRAA